MSSISEDINGMFVLLKKESPALIFLIALSILIPIFLTESRLISKEQQTGFTVGLALLSISIIKIKEVFTLKIQKAILCDPPDSAYDPYNCNYIEKFGVLWAVEHKFFEYAGICGPFCPECRQGLETRIRQIFTNEWKCYNCKKLFKRPDNRSDGDLRSVIYQIK